MKTNLYRLMRLVAYFICPTVLLIASGCNAVYVSQPIGQKPHVLEKAAWEGYWSCFNENNWIFRLRVTDASEGRMQLTAQDEKDGKPVLVTYELTVREAGDMLLATIAIPNEKPGRLVWTRIIQGRDLALLWLPDVRKFGTLVRDGKLRGRIENNDVFLDPPSAEELKALVTGDFGVPFDWDSPLIFQRVTR